MSSAIALSDRRHAEQIAVLRAELACAQAARGLVLSFGIAAVDGRLADGGLDSAGLHEIAAASATLSEDRKSVVSGKSVSVRVDLGGRRIVQQKQTPKDKIRVYPVTSSRATQ